MFIAKRHYLNCIQTSTAEIHLRVQGRVPVSFVVVCISTVGLRTVDILHCNCDITAHLSHHQPLMCFSLLHVSLNIARKWPKYLGSLPHICISTDTIFTAIGFPPGAAGFTLLHKMQEQQYT